MGFRADSQSNGCVAKNGPSIAIHKAFFGQLPSLVGKSRGKSSSGAREKGRAGKAINIYDDMGNTYALDVMVLPEAGVVTRSSVREHEDGDKGRGNAQLCFVRILERRVADVVCCASRNREVVLPGKNIAAAVVAGT